MGSNGSPSNPDLSQMMIHAVCHRTETERSHAFRSFEVRLFNMEARQQIYRDAQYGSEPSIGSLSAKKALEIQ